MLRMGIRSGVALTRDKETWYLEHVPTRTGGCLREEQLNSSFGLIDLGRLREVLRVLRNERDDGKQGGGSWSFDTVGAVLSKTRRESSFVADNGHVAGGLRLKSVGPTREPLNRTMPMLGAWRLTSRGHLEVYPQRGDWGCHCRHLVSFFIVSLLSEQNWHCSPWRVWKMSRGRGESSSNPHSIA